MRDLSAFNEDNAKWKAQRKRIPWERRVELIDKEFPFARKVDFNVLLRDNEVFGRIIRDILKVDQIEPGRAGPRPSLDYARGMQSWREITGQDYAEVPFVQAFRSLARGQSFAQIARKISVSKTRAWKLWQGVDQPSTDDLRAIAEAFGKKPAYFAEYRAEFVMAAIAARLAEESELATAIYSKLVRS